MLPEISSAMAKNLLDLESIKLRLQSVGSTCIEVGTTERFTSAWIIRVHGTCMAPEYRGKLAVMTPAASEAFPLSMRSLAN